MILSKRQTKSSEKYSVTIEENYDVRDISNVNHSDKKRIF